MIAPLPSPIARLATPDGRITEPWLKFLRNAGSNEIATESLPSASTVDLGSVPGRVISISGTTTITSLGTSAPAGTIKYLVFAGTLTLTHNASTLILTAQTNCITRAGDVIAFQYEGGSRWREIFWHPANYSDLNQSANGGTRDLTAEDFPSGENQEGRCLSWVPGLKRLAFRHPKIAFGPAALDAGTGNIALVDTTWTAIYTAVPVGSYPTGGFRSGMVGYLPKGRWMFWGQVAVRTPSTNVEYYARVQQGNTETNPAQPNMAVGSPGTVGGGAATSPGTANRIFSVPFMASDILVDTAFDHAAEVWVEIYPDGAGAGAGNAMSSTSVGVTSTLSKGTFLRMDGLHG